MNLAEDIAPIPDLPTTTTTSTTLPPATTLPPTTTTILPSYTVTGVVRQSDGTPVARAVITMGEHRTTSGADGWFSFATSEPTDLVVSKPGWSSVELEWQEAPTVYEASIEPQRLRGIRVSAEAAGDDALYSSLLQLAEDTAINTFVFDSKQEGGKVLYDSGVADAQAIGAVEARYDPVTRLRQAHRAGLYTITRHVTFEDTIRADAFPDERLAGWWVDPESESARAYNLALAEEACSLGFDEVMFDYVRYPSGQTATISGQLDMLQEERIDNIASFLADARNLLHPMGCAVSAAVFGIITSTPNDQGVGQRPEELSGQVDTLSPMIYPSHYSPGWLGFEDPNEHPYDVTAAAINDARARMEPGSGLRPWLQAFWWTNEQIRRSIQAAEDLGTGWTLWNVRSNYDVEAIPTDAELAS